MGWRFPQRMRRRIHKFTLSWTKHRLALMPYKRSNGGFHDDFHHHAARLDSEARLALLHEGINHLESLISHCTSSYEAMPNLLIRPPLPWPFLAMSRISLESAARICYAIDPAIDADQRLMRLSALIAWSEHEASKAVSATPGSAATSEVERERERLKARAEAIEDSIAGAGYHLDRTPRDPVVRDPSGLRKPEPSNLALVDVLEKQFPAIGNQYYRRSSGYVHGAPWILLSTTSSLSGRKAFVPNVTRSQTVDTFLIVTIAVTNAMKLSASYSGIPFGQLNTQSDRLIDDTVAETRRLLRPDGRSLRRWSRREPRGLQ